THLLGISIDITERKHAEDELRKLFRAIEQSPVSVVITDADGRIEYVNAKFSEVTGYAVHEVLGRNPRILQSGLTPIEVYQTMWQTILGGLQWRGKLQNRKKNGELFWEEIHISAIRDGEGRTTNFVAVKEDITERMKVERMKSEFISTVSHELRTPLTSIRGALALIVGGVMGELPATIKPLVDIAHKNSERLILLVNDILDVEKIEAGKMEFDMHPINLMPLLKQALEGNHAYAEQFNVTYELESELPEMMVNVDANRLMQVMANLLSNAAKFSPSGDKVKITAVSNGKHVRVSVSNRGTGIPEQFRSQIFQKFAQADSSDTRKKGGTGLGLSITKAIVEQMGGSIGFDSQTDVLTTFFFEFPVWQEAIVATPAPMMAAVVKRRVLICENDRDIAALLHMMLEQAGLTADIAYNAGQAKQLLVQGGYTAMTLDLELPDQDGIALIHELRAAEQTATLPIVVVSANAVEGRKKLSSEAFRVIDWISKPIDQEQLVAVLKQIMRQASGVRPKVLHVEDDLDVFMVVNAIVGEFAEVDNATSLADAQRMLEHDHYDLAILDLSLPDGVGMKLLPLLNGASPPTPVLVFSAREVRHE
ncbi:MAG TPA: ATP-binding protein, partial [Gallionella sp.]|nr:ATP-binding protein [Gallionella sp.]